MRSKLISSENVSIVSKTERYIRNDLIIGKYAAEMEDHLEEMKLNKKWLVRLDTLVDGKHTKKT